MLTESFWSSTSIRLVAALVAVGSLLLLGSGFGSSSQTSLSQLYIKVIKFAMLPKLDLPSLAQGLLASSPARCEVAILEAPVAQFDHLRRWLGLAANHCRLQHSTR